MRRGTVYRPSLFEHRGEAKSGRGWSSQRSGQGRRGGGVFGGRSHASGRAQGGAVRPRLFLPAALLPRGTNALVAETVLTRGFGRRSEMAEEVLPSAKWLYCGEPNESQRAVLGKDCGAGAVPHNSHFRLGAVTVLPPPRRTLFPAGPKSPPHPHPAASPRPAASVSTT